MFIKNNDINRDDSAMVKNSSLTDNNNYNESEYMDAIEGERSDEKRSRKNVNRRTTSL